MTLREVIKRVLRNEPLKQDELQGLASWLLSDKGQEDFHEALQAGAEDLQADESLDYDVLLKQLHNRIDRKKKLSVKRRAYRYLWLTASAAAIVALGVFGLTRFINSETGSEVEPHTHKAVLTLADGRNVLLGGEQSEEIRQDGAVINIRDNRIGYTSDSAGHAGDYNLLSVRRGGEYTLTLGDGTVVWMNSGSSLKYPMQFTGSERRVILEGEAYFQVVADTGKPFIVETSCQEVRVLGTKFNVSAYANESTVTTLVEGSVNLTHSVTLREHKLVPGEQVSVDPETNEMTVTRVNTGDVIAWTQGMFAFNDNTLEQVMRKLERWYDVTVIYTDPKAKEIVFKGNLPRYLDLEVLLEMIEKISPVRFKSDQKQVEVTLK